MRKLIRNILPERLHPRAPIPRQTHQSLRFTRGNLLLTIRDNRFQLISQADSYRLPIPLRSRCRLLTRLLLHLVALYPCLTESR